MIDDKEYPCVFPKESGLTSNMYRTDRVYNVRFSKTLKKVYDMWAMITCIVGLIFSVAAVIFTFEIIKELGFII